MNDVLSEYRAGDSSDRAEQMLVVCDWSVCGSMGCVLVRGIGRVCWPNGFSHGLGSCKKGQTGGFWQGFVVFPVRSDVRVRVGFVRFSGLCVVREITERDYEDSEGNHVSNLFVQPAIAWKAQVLQAEVVERSAIATPWTSRHAKHSSMILYHLGPVVRLDRPIANVDPSQTSFRSDRWTTQLALDRAVAAAEICLETESEWKLYEALKSRHVEFRLRLDLISRDPDDMPRGRTWFLLSPNHAVRFDGANGFLQVIGTMQRFTSLEAIVNEAISGRDPSA